MMRPRGSLARALYNKHLSDEHLETLDKREWYSVETSNLSSTACSLFKLLCPDEQTEEFLESSRQLSNQFFTQVFHSLVKFFLGFFMTQTSINGWLKRGSMFVFSSAQFAEMTGRSLGQIGDLIDLGAGDGSTTQNMAPYFSNVSVTEISKPMRTVLSQKGFRVLELDTWSEKKYDVITCLNVLDRCDKPLTLLSEIKASLKPDGIAIIAIVLPFKPYVEVGRSDHKPSEYLNIVGDCFEVQINSMIEDVLQPAGFKVHSWTRLPYLCEGDLNQAFYWLSDAVFVISPQHSDLPLSSYPSTQNIEVKT